jgi:hypothetical protein
VDCRISLKAEDPAAGTPQAPTADVSLRLEWGLAPSGRLSLGVAVEEAALLVHGAAEEGSEGGAEARFSAAYRLSLGCPEGRYSRSEP